MADSNYDRLTQFDNSFLVSSRAIRPGMHVASTQIHEAAPLRATDGAIDIERIQEYVESRAWTRIPRYRQRLAYTPVEGHPVWVDDPSFNIRYHVRHSRLPYPGNERQLKRMVGRIFSQRLDRGKPLWELWVIEGLEGDRVAFVSKVHHCMVDGVSGAELISARCSPRAVQEKVDPPARWDPRPVPSRLAWARRGRDGAGRARAVRGRLRGHASGCGTRTTPATTWPNACAGSAARRTRRGRHDAGALQPAGRPAPPHRLDADVARGRSRS